MKASRIRYRCNLWKRGEIQTETSHEIMARFVIRKLVLQTRMRSHTVGLDVWFLVGPVVYFHTLCLRTGKALARLRGCAGSPEPSLVAFVISTINSWAGWNYLWSLSSNLGSRFIYITILNAYWKKDKTHLNVHKNRLKNRYNTFIHCSWN